MGSRIESLDGLRGLSALIVLLHHCMLVSPILAIAYLNHRATGPISLALYPPGHFLWLGTEAVYIFFVLSGLVLTLPFLGKRPDRGWAAYYGARLCRLYVPLFAAALFAAAATIIALRNSRPEQSWWMNEHAAPWTALSVAKNAVVILGNTPLNTALWSLRWEVFFSLLLPVYVYSVRRPNFRALPAFPLCILAIALGESLGTDFLVYLPMFACGSILALRLGSIGSFASRLSPLIRLLLFLGALFALAADWIPFLAKTAFATPLAVVGACGIIVSFSLLPGVGSFGRLPPLQWIGAVSFSLYLTHEPIVVSVATLTGQTNPLIVAALSVPLALGVAQLFFWVVERPSHRASRAITTLLTKRGSGIEQDKSFG